MKFNVHGNGQFTSCKIALMLQNLGLQVSNIRGLGFKPQKFLQEFQLCQNWAEFPSFKEDRRVNCFKLFRTAGICL